MIPSVRFAHFISFVLSFYSFTSFAQKIELELVAGPAMVSTRLSGRDNDDRKLKIAPLAGVGFHYHFTKHWSIATQLLYERKGFCEKGDISYNSYSYFNLVFTSYKLVNNLDYLSLPLMARYSFGKKIQWYVGAGGYISYLLKAEDTLTAYGPFTDESDLIESYINIDAGIRMTIGATVPVNENLKLTCSLNESIGFVDISKSIGSSRLMTNSLSLQVGISYMLTGK